MFSSQEILSSLVWFQMIFNALRSEKFRFTEFENLKNPGIQPTDVTGSFICAHDPYFTLIPEPENDTELLTVTENEF